MLPVRSGVRQRSDSGAAPAPPAPSAAAGVDEAPEPASSGASASDAPDGEPEAETDGGLLAPLDGSSPGLPVHPASRSRAAATAAPERTGLDVRVITSASFVFTLSPMLTEATKTRPPVERPRPPEVRRAGNTPTIEA